MLTTDLASSRNDLRALAEIKRSLFMECSLLIFASKDDVTAMLAAGKFSSCESFYQRACSLLMYECGGGIDRSDVRGGSNRPAAVMQCLILQTDFSLLWKHKISHCIMSFNLYFSLWFFLVCIFFSNVRFFYFFFIRCCKRYFYESQFQNFIPS